MLRGHLRKWNLFPLAEGKVLSLGIARCRLRILEQEREQWNLDITTVMGESNQHVKKNMLEVTLNKITAGQFNHMTNLTGHKALLCICVASFL